MKYKEIIYQLQSLTEKAASNRASFLENWLSLYDLNLESFKFLLWVFIRDHKEIIIFLLRIVKKLTSVSRIGLWCEISLCNTYFLQTHLLSSSLSCESCRRGNKKQLPSWLSIPLQIKQFALKSWCTVLFTKVTKTYGYIKLMNIINWLYS